MAEPRHQTFTEITCPDTGRPIMVARSVRDDPVGALYADARISEHQYRAALAYQEDVEALTGRTRANSNGPDDLTWRGSRPGGYRVAKHHANIERAHAALGPARTQLIKRILVENSLPPTAHIREFGLALDQLAISYGMATPTRH
jgi:hypothetical protein